MIKRNRKVQGDPGGQHQIAGALDIHDGPEHMLQSEAGYIDARPHRQDRRNLLHRTAGPYKWSSAHVIGQSIPRPLCSRMADLGATLATPGTIPPRWPEHTWAPVAPKNSGTGSTGTAV
jgi:hypothetical protein